MRGFMNVLSVAVLLAVAGCVSSAQVATTAEPADDGPGCYRLALQNFTVQQPDCLPYWEEQGDHGYFTLCSDGEEGECDEAHNTITIDFWVADERYDLDYRLADHLRARNELAELAFLMEFSPVRTRELNGRQMFVYNVSHPYSFDDGRLMRGRYALFALENGRLYAAVTGIWEAARHEEMSAAFDTVAATLDVEVVGIRPIPCSVEEPAPERPAPAE